MKTVNIEKAWKSQLSEHGSETKKSVSETRGKVITYKNKLIEPYFHALSVGMTLDSREWFGKDLPYIREKKA